MSIIMIPVLAVGPILLIISYIVKNRVARIIYNLVGVTGIVLITYVANHVHTRYLIDHREAENYYHKEIIKTLNDLILENKIQKAHDLTQLYLKKTEKKTFMRNTLHEIIEITRAENQNEVVPVNSASASAESE